MNLLERIKYLEEKVKSFWIIDSEDVIAEDTGMGIALHLEDPYVDDAEAEGDTYKGYFKVVDISTPAVPAKDGNPAQAAVAKIKIINGINADDTNCFKGYINKIKKTIPVEEEIIIIAAGVIYLEFVPVGSKPITGFTCTFKQASELPAYDESKGFEQISQILFSDGKINDFSQPTGINSRIIYWGDC